DFQDVAGRWYLFEGECSVRLGSRALHGAGLLTEQRDFRARNGRLAFIFDDAGDTHVRLSQEKRWKEKYREQSADDPKGTVHCFTPTSYRMPVRSPEPSGRRQLCA